MTLPAEIAGLSAAALSVKWRAAPSSRLVALALGLARLREGDPRAVETLETLARRDDLAEAWQALAAARLRFGAAEAAAADLQTLLGRHVLVPDLAFARMVDAAAHSVGAPGWCCMVDGQAGLLRVTLTPSSAAARPDLTLQDETGRNVAFTRLRRGRGETGLRVRLDPQHVVSALTVTIGDRPLLGSPIALDDQRRSEGFVVARDGGLAGWCWFPRDAAREPQLVLANGLDPSLALTIPADRPRLDQPSDLMLRHRAFTVSRERLASLGPGAVSVTVAGGMPLYGSPLDPLAEIEEAIARARAVARLWPAPQAPIPALRERGVDVIIPVHRGRETTLACLASVMAHAAAGQRILVLADGVPDRPLLAALAEHHRRGAIVLHESADNSGFPATVNRGLRLSAGHDVVLLNSDTVVTPGWLDRLRQAVHAAPDIGTATPLSNDATIFSYPRPNAVNPMPDADEIQAIASVAAQVNAGVTVDVPTGHGFCLFIRAECLAETGLLREDVFAQGYGEENDFCLRARDLGWRSVAVPGVYVAHVGSQSFNAARSDLIARNLAALNRLHVGYDRRVADWIAADPLHVLRRRIDRARFAAARQGRKTVLLVTHDREGGVRQNVRDRALGFRTAGLQALILKPQRRDGRYRCAFDAATDGTYCNLSFDWATEQAALRAFLASADLLVVEIHHLLGHDFAVTALLRAICPVTDIYLHDYAWYCPRITLTNAANRYCGEPDLAGCETCIADFGARTGEAIGPTLLQQRSAALFAEARTLVAPSPGTARRFADRFGRAVVARRWENDTAIPPPPPPPPWSGDRPRRICVVGGIGPEKGYDLLLDCARFIRDRKLPLHLHVVGFTSNDRSLLNTGQVTITGRYDEDEVLELIRAQNADFGFLPSLWPETWSHVLTQMWLARLNVVAFDLGAPAERIRDRRGGRLIPPDAQLPQILQLFLSPAPFG